MRGLIAACIVTAAIVAVIVAPADWLRQALITAAAVVGGTLWWLIGGRDA